MAHKPRSRTAPRPGPGPTGTARGARRGGAAGASRGPARLTRKQRRRRERRWRQRRRRLFNAGVVGGLGLLLALAAAAIFYDVEPDPYAGVSVTGLCYPSEPHAYDIHAYLTLRITDDDGNTTLRYPPEAVGEEPDCIRAVHTHAANGELHVHMDRYRPVTLGDFFTIWGESFNATSLLEYRADAEHEIVVTVDDEPSTAFERLELAPDREIVIEYRPRE